MRHKILLIEDDSNFADAFAFVFKRQNIDVVIAPTGASAISKFKNDPHGFAVAVIDYELPDLKGSEVRQQLKKINPDQLIIFSTGHNKEDLFADMLSVGANGFLRKGDSIDSLQILDVVKEQIKLYETKHRLAQANDFDVSIAEAEMKLAGITARSSAMYEILQRVRNYSQSTYPVLLVGETGVGKELIAKALVPQGKQLVTVNCPAYIDKESLLESELFGHVKGAFTGADKETIGLVMRAHQNVLFLDELHQLSLSAQAKLLRFLQEMTFRKVGDGSGRESKIDFRLVSAVQPDIENRIADGRFLPDLYNRVRVLMIRVPSLRERKEDIEPLILKIQDEFNRLESTKIKKQFRLSTITKLADLPWVGNVRELMAVVKQLLTDCPGQIVEPVDLKKYLETNSLSPQHKASTVKPHEEAQKQFDIQFFIDALKQSHTRKEAAKKLNIPSSTFTRRLQDLGIDPDIYLLDGDRRGAHV